MAEDTIPTESGDGVIDGRDASFATARTKDPGDNADHAGATFAAASRISGGINIIERAFMALDFTGIPPGSIITKVILHVWATSKANDINDPNAWINVFEATQPSTSALTTADYDLCGGTALSASINIDTITIGGFNQYELNASGLSLANAAIADFLKLCLLEGHDATGTDPSYSGTQANKVNFSSSEEATAGQRPKAVVTYTPPGSFIPRQAIII